MIPKQSNSCYPNQL